MIGAPGSELATLQLLERGELEILGLLPHSSNYTFLARVRAEPEEALAVYKPRRGEMPLWDFPDGTLCRREVAAYDVAEALGWPAVPPTVLREGPEGPGSVQLFVEHDPDEHYFTMRERRPDDFRRIAAFDVVINNADRKGGHCLLAGDDRIFLVDHGVSFSVEPKLRTVIWDFAGDPLPEDLCADIARLGAELSGGGLRHRLGELLTPREVEATLRRTERLVASGRFPQPGPGRPYPWPPV
jgi:uncharacterized repeat protein (TIGR03843 family)